MVTKDQANYRPVSRDKQKCKGCVGFSNGTCLVVSGSINPNGTCDFWEKK